MKVYKCDRCGKYFDDAPVRLGGASLIGGVLHLNWYPESVDLCKDCGTELKNILKEWWKGLAGSKKRSFTLVSKEK